jgi:hypothetical protein
MRLLTDEYVGALKPKHSAEDTYEAGYRLSDDGELVQIIEEDEMLATHKVKD